MHLLAAKPGGFSDEEGIIDLRQSPGDLVILSSQDTSLGLLAEVADAEIADSKGTDNSAPPRIRLANLVNLLKPAAYDLYEAAVLQHAKVIVVSLLGGVNYWRYGVERLVILAKQHAIRLIVVPGDEQFDGELLAHSNCTAKQAHTVWRYLREGGVANTQNLFAYLRFDAQQTVAPPLALAPCLIYAKDCTATLVHWQKNKNAALPTALLLFYRAHLQSGNTAAFDAFIKLLQAQFNVLAVAALSLKDSNSLAMVNHLIAQINCQVIINTTSFSQHLDGNAALSSEPQPETRLFAKNIPVLQAILAANDVDDWANSTQGLRSRDLAMNVALPEYDGRIITRAISFKALYRRSATAQIDIVRYELHAERAQFVSDLAYRWAQLSIKKNAAKRVAVVLANYPTKDGRIGNGVGLDTPASTINILTAMAANGFAVQSIPENGDALMRQLQTGVTNDLDSIPLKHASQGISVAQYQTWFAQIPTANQQAVMQRWGAPEQDPKYRNGHIIVAGINLGGTFVGIQPARGFNVDVVANYHDPDLVPPHAYLAFYFWLRHVYQADAIAHIGKHGNLEWLPGKSVALSAQCWPDVALGPLPHLYPFIVNDPGEGAQAKRRAQAVILDHLMPPMARAETYGELQELEGLVDELYQAMGLDHRREIHLRKKIIALVRSTNLAQELNLESNLELNLAADEDAWLAQIDAYLCDLKEAQIRHGLHRFGQLPVPAKLTETLVALVRLPRGDAAKDRGLLHCLSADLQLSHADGSPFDPLKLTAATPWQGPRPAILQQLSDDHWRNQADTRERLELLAQRCIDAALAQRPLGAELPRTAQLLAYIKSTVLPAVIDSGKNELRHFIGALQGEFVPAGPSGAPTRGRLDVLPTGRNFYSLDARAVPTKSAWELGQLSAEQLLSRHLQEHGDYPKQLGLSVWGSSTMRTGGDDIAQAFALLGVRPLWAQGSNRVVDIEVIPAVTLGRPRVDVTLRISGFFRDAFPSVARLFDTAIQTLADYADPGGLNPLREHIQNAQQALIAQGLSPEEAQTQARLRVFGAKPGSYGAGLQGLIDAGIWDDKTDLAKAYVNWGGYSYSKENFGQAAFHAFETRLSAIEVVVQNQDNREHDLLDSDDYYQFQGGMSNAVEVLRGVKPTVYHGDHSNPAAPKIRTLKEELNRVIRSRVTNPKWLSAMREHGYKGAFEMAAAVDYLFAYDATTDLIADYQYQSVTDSLLMDKQNRAFLEQVNPNALKEMAERLLEAQQRGLWRDPQDYKDKLTAVILEIDDSLEQISS